MKELYLKVRVVSILLCLFSFTTVTIASTQVNREFVPLVNAQLNVKGMKMFSGRALEQFTIPLPIWTDTDYLWQSINELKYLSGKWNTNEDAPKEAYSSCVALKQKYKQQGHDYRILADFNTPSGGPLVDNKLNPIVYDVLLNREAVAAINQYKSGQFFFPGQISENKTPGSILIKFAWQIRDDVTNYPKQNIYQQKVLTRLPDWPNCKITNVALLGFHIAMKPQPNTIYEGKLIKSSKFTWATYLHSEVTPSYLELKKLDKYSKNQWLLYNQGRQVVDKVLIDNCPLFDEYNNSCCQANSSELIGSCGPLIKKILANKNCMINKPSSEVRSESANLVQMCTNSNDTEVKAPKLMPPWDEYQLLDIQWNSVTGGIIPTILSNPVLEPDFIHFKGTQTGNLSCFNCHQQASKTDTIFSIKSLLKR